jgi:hypothetical protein
VQVDQLVAAYPRLYHVAEAGSWPAIRELGLLTTAQLVAASDPAPEIRAAILDRPRTRSFTLTHPQLGPVVIRDQRPLRPDILARKLTGLTVAQWLALLNDRVFFWLDQRRLDTLLNARVNRGRPHDVLTVDTASLVATWAGKIALSPLNSGATLFPNAAPRGPDTFRTIADYPYDTLRRQRGPANAIAELAVIGGVPDLAQHVLQVERRHGTAPNRERLIVGGAG